MHETKILAILAILLGLAGLGVLLYPSVSNWMEQAKQRRQIAAYQEAQAQMEQKGGLPCWQKPTGIIKAGRAWHQLRYAGRGGKGGTFDRRKIL